MPSPNPMDPRERDELKERLTLDTTPGHGRLNLLGQYIDMRRRPTIGHSQLWNVIGGMRADISQLIAEVEHLRSIVDDVSAIVGHTDAPYRPDLLAILNPPLSSGAHDGK